MTTTKDNITKLIPFVKSVSGKSAQKALISMARMLNSSLLEAGIDIDVYIKDYKADNIFDPSCLLGNHSDLYAFVQKDYVEFARIMFEARPVGLGTPNAMVGEGEFMALFCSPRVGISKKKNTGDITVDGKTIELKGTELRFFSPLRTTGKQVQAHANSISKLYNVSPNLSTGSRTAYEPWDNGNSKKLNKRQHWISQFNKLGETKSKEYLNNLCKSFMPCQEEDFNPCFKEGIFNAIELQMLIVRKFFSGMEKKWDAFTQIDNGKITCITDDQTKFEKLIAEGKLATTANYFRSFQDITVGLYVKLQ